MRLRQYRHPASQLSPPRHIVLCVSMFYPKSRTLGQ